MVMTVVAYFASFEAMHWVGLVMVSVPGLMLLVPGGDPVSRASMKIKVEDQ